MNKERIKRLESKGWHDIIDEIEVLEEDVKFLLSFAPDKPPEGLDPTFYHTLTYKGDLELWDRIKKMRTSHE